MALTVNAVDAPGLTPYRMPDRFRHDIAYFMSLPGEPGVPDLAAGEFWVALDRARVWLDDGVFRLPSPLDSANSTEVELSEEQEDWLRWMVEHRVQRVRLAGE